MLLRVAALDPAKQCELELRPQACETLTGSSPLAVRPAALTRLRWGDRFSKRSVPSDSKRLAARGAQVVQHGQQDQRDVAAAALQAFDVNRELHHRARQRVEPVLAALAGTQRSQVLATELHFLDEQGCAIGFGDLQCAAGLVQQLARRE